MGNASSSTTIGNQLILPGGKPRNKTGGKVLNTKIRNAEKTGVLSLTGHSLKKVPLDVLALVNLKSLDLSLNSISELPSFASLRNLKSLRLDGNKLEVLPGLASLQCLTDLSVSRNKLGPSADAVSSLPVSLKKLDLSKNLFTEVPLALLKPTPELQSLNLSENSISILPSLQELPSLVELVLDGNAITKIDSSIMNLAALKTLSLRCNSIAANRAHQSLAKELFECTEVTTLNLEGNMISKTELLDMQGISSFMERREKSKDKSLAGGALVSFSLCGLD